MASWLILQSESIGNQGSGWIEVPQASAASQDAVFQAAQDMRKQVDAHYNRMSEEYNRRAEAAASISGEGAKTAEPDQDLAAEAEYMCPRLYVYIYICIYIYIYI